MDKLNPITKTIIENAEQRNKNKAYLVAISGIDAAGKGAVTNKIFQELTKLQYNVAVIPADNWLQVLPDDVNYEISPEYFYNHCYRWDEMFNELIIPLNRTKTIYLEKELFNIQKKNYYFQIYDFQDTDIILLEGIFLLRKEWRNLYDLSVWIDCDFNSALKRAMIRNQEGLPLQALVNDYKKLYFPAQHIHLINDQPKAFADSIYLNLNS